MHYRVDTSTEKRADDNKQNEKQKTKQMKLIRINYLLWTISERVDRMFYVPTKMWMIYHSTEFLHGLFHKYEQNFNIINITETFIACYVYTQLYTQMYALSYTFQSLFCSEYFFLVYSTRCCAVLCFECFRCALFLFIYRIQQFHSQLLTNTFSNGK